MYNTLKIMKSYLLKIKICHYWAQIIYSQLNLSSISLNKMAVGDALNSSMKFVPLSADMARLGSIGIAPRNGTPACSASFWPPPFEKIFVQSLQLGQTNPLMFSTIPKMLRFAFRQNVSSRRTSPTATACSRNI